MKKFKAFLKEQPSEAQIKAGNYKKKHMRFCTCDIAIENRKGSVRSGTDPDGKEWSVKMPFDYGYIKRTNGADGDAVDVFVGPDKKSERIFTINQTDDKGKFDEHKVMMGFTDKKDAEKGYLSAYDKGWSNYEKDIIEMDIDTFKKWLDVKSQKKPMTESFVLLLKENTEINGLAQMKKFAKSAILKMSQTEQLSEMSFAQMKSVEQHADDIFSSLNIDVKLRGHFFDRLNDARNGREITEAEMIHLFNATFKKYGAKIAHMSKGHEAVIFDHMNNINVPFLIDFDNVTGQLVLIPKTVMRKKNFLTRTQKLKV